MEMIRFRHSLMDRQVAQKERLGFLILCTINEVGCHIVE